MSAAVGDLDVHRQDRGTNRVITLTMDVYEYGARENTVADVDILSDLHIFIENLHTICDAEEVVAID
jgi:hypothetical protein